MRVLTLYLTDEEYKAINNIYFAMANEAKNSQNKSEAIKKYHLESFEKFCAFLTSIGALTIVKISMEAIKNGGGKTKL
ncbi:MAG: hypothetical protein QXO37_06955 [Candidatus Nitrosocaldaceae archaeon]